MATLLISQIHANGHLKRLATNKALTAAAALGGPVHVLVAGGRMSAPRLPRSRQALRCRKGPASPTTRPTVIDLAESLAALIVSPRTVTDVVHRASATSRFKNVMPRVAAPCST